METEVSQVLTISNEQVMYACTAIATALCSLCGFIAWLMRAHLATYEKGRVLDQQKIQSLDSRTFSLTENMIARQAQISERIAGYSQQQAVAVDSINDSLLRLRAIDTAIHTAVRDASREARRHAKNISGEHSATDPRS